jgi:dihydropteroate synthase
MVVSREGSSAPASVFCYQADMPQPRTPIRVMGVLNVTPDSFSDGGRFAGQEAALARARKLIADGADILDVGGESTRPGAAPVDEAEEIARVEPLIRELAAQTRARISIDTMKPGVARAAVAAGAVMWNDVTALRHAPDSLATAAALGCDVVLMHMQGEPGTMQADPRYGDVVTEVRDHLVARAEAATAAGVTEVWIDPGFGFGKTVEHNLDLLAHLDVLVATGWPVAVGTSRKSTLGRLLAESDETDELPPLEDRLEASLATATWAMAHGAGMIRAHDVRATVQAALVVQGENTK